MKCTDNFVGIQLRGVCKTYKGDNECQVLNDVSYDFQKGGFYCVIGHSGAGKSTLLQILGGLDTPTEGEVFCENQNIINLNQNQKSKFRKEKIGFVFQSFYLMPHLTALENVIFPMLINEKIKAKERKRKAKELLELVGMEKRANHRPKQMSGGEQQRVAIARALANNPDYILADEPTGNVDRENELKILNIFHQLQEKGKTIIVVTHNDEVKNHADYVITMEDGHLA